MAPNLERERLGQLAFIYVAMARCSTDYLSDDVLNAVTDSLQARSGGAGRSNVERAVARALKEHDAAEDKVGRSREVAEELYEVLAPAQRHTVMDDLRQIAELDGVVERNERGMLQALASTWGIERDPRSPDPGRASWGVLHDLAYIFLVLAHSTDDELSDTELEVMFNKLREWEPGVPPDEVERVLEEAMSAYAEGRDAERLESAIQSVRRRLPREQRMAALNDLVKIANADGVFLDDEEDLINHLLSEWDVDPYASYGPHGNKGEDGTSQNEKAGPLK